MVMVMVMERDRAIILQSLVVRESDILLRVLTESFGKIQLLARGARKSRKRFMGGLEIFDSGVIEFGKRGANSTSIILEQFNRGAPWLNLAGSLDALVAAALCVEVTDLFCPFDDESCGVLFEPLYRTLRTINTYPQPAQALSTALYYTLTVIDQAGLSLVEVLKPEELVWFLEMQSREKPIVPDDLSQFQSVALVVNYLEEEAGERMRCKAQVIQTAQRIAKGSAAG